MWEERFAASQDYLFGTDPTQFLTDHRHFLTAGQHALSVADGEGRNSVYMAQQGLKVTALEFAPSAIERARQLALARGVSLRQVSADMLVDDWVEEEKFHLVVGIFIQFASPAERKKQFEDIQRSCKPGGLVMIHGYTAKQLEFGTGGPPFADRMYDEAQMRRDFTDWEILECRAYEREIPKGRGHSGMSALLDLIALKPQ